MERKDHPHVIAHSTAERTPRLSRLRTFYQHHHRACGAIINAFLIVICVIAYFLLVILFITPSSFSIDSLIWAEASGIKPQVAIALLSAVISTCTGTLITRLVEHFFWLRISSPPTVNSSDGGGQGSDGLRLAEVRDLADWTISPLGRLLYIFSGDFWIFKFTGLLMFGIAVLNPVLVSGVSQKADRMVATSTILQKHALYRVWIDESNNAYAGGSFWDNPVQIAATVSLNNLSTPAKPTICCSEAETCSVTSRAGAIQATCIAEQLDNTVNPGGGYTSRMPSRSFRSKYNPDLYVVLRSGNPNVFANFSTLRSADGIPPMIPSTNGTFGVLFGAYISESTPTTLSSYDRIHTVDCLLSFGTARVTQTGQKPPTIDRDSFIRAKEFVTSVPGLSVTQRMYNEVEQSSPFNFVGRVGGAALKPSLVTHAIGLGILGLYAEVSEETAASRIEKAWDAATLMAWARFPEASEETVVTRETTRQVYVYSKLVLVFLVLPVIAVGSAAVGTGMRVGAKNNVLGYDPVSIAARGPVEGVEGGWGFLPDELEDRVVRGKNTPWGKGFEITNQ